MRYILFVSTLLLAMFNSVDGNTQDAAKIFTQVAEALTKLSFLQYDSYREINNYKDNYFAKNSGTSYLDFASGAEGKALRLQLRSEKSLQVYNGTEFFQLNESDKTSVFSKKTSARWKISLFCIIQFPHYAFLYPLLPGMQVYQNQ